MLSEKTQTVACGILLTCSSEANQMQNQLEKTRDWKAIWWTYLVTYIVYLALCLIISEIDNMVVEYMQVFLCFFKVLLCLLITKVIHTDIF